MASKVQYMLQIQGQAPKLIEATGGATLRKVLEAAKQNPDGLYGAVTVNGANADMSLRLKKGDLIAVTPKVAGGR
jgi:molybdopterin converting factor small subunit